MKFLGLRLCEHDSNMSYFDGKKVSYFKLERYVRKKHAAYENFEDWIEEIKEIWDIEIKDLDEIGIVFDPWRYNLSKKNDNFFPSKKFKYLPYNITRINHHYAHALSCWPVETQCNNHFVFDAYGDYKISWSFFQNDKLIDLGLWHNEYSLGNLIIEAANELGIEDKTGLGYAGKLMGLQAYGKINDSYLEKLNVFSIRDIKIIFNFELWIQHMGDKLLARLHKLDWIATVHHYIGCALIKHFKNYIDVNDLVSFSGGCAQNVVWNTQLKNTFKNLVVFPHCSDEGLSLGILEFFRKKHKLPLFSNKNFPYWQITR